MKRRKEVERKGDGGEPGNGNRRDEEGKRNLAAAPGKRKWKKEKREREREKPQSCLHVR